MSILRRKKEPLELTVPLAVAYYGIAKCLRSFRKARKTRFLAALVVPDPQSFQYYYQAATRFVEETNGLGVDPNFALEDVQHVAAGSSVAEIEKLLTKASKRGIILFDSEELLTENVSLAADVCLVIPQPTSAYFVAAVRQVLNAKLSLTDAVYLTSVPTTQLQLAFLTNRPPKQVLNRLRLLPKNDASRGGASEIEGPTLLELAGYGEAKTWGIELAKDLADWKEGLIDWADVDRGVLLSGPPGTGKTMFATALARTCGVPIVHGSASDWQSSGQGYLGDMLGAMQAAFSEAKAKAPCILFIDEIDAFGDRRKVDKQNSDYRRQVVNGFLQCLDGSEKRDGVVVVGATNDPDNVDPAIKRPSRLGRHVQIELPDADDRIKILEHHAQLKLSLEARPKFARATRGMTGDDIGQIVREAKRAARQAERMVTEIDVLDRLPVLRDIPHVYLHQNAVHEVGHAIVAVLLEDATVAAIQIDTMSLSDLERQPVGIALIERRPCRRHTRAYFDDSIAMLLAGIAAEELILGGYSDSGTGDDSADLIRATNLATAVEGCLAMGDSLLVELWQDVRSLERMRDRDPSLRDRADAVLRGQFERAKSLLSDNLSLLKDLADELLEKRVLDGVYVGRLIRERGNRPDAFWQMRA